jgi:beta-lactam-binding protein with PASTA domain
MPQYKRIFAIFLGGLAMILVAGTFAILALRLAIHGREVEVPNLAGKSDAEAADIAKDLGLNLSVENRFYSPAVQPNHVLSQLPSPGAHVRRGWQVRVTESLGTQNVLVPDVRGITERPATVMLRRVHLEVGSVAHLPAPAPAGIVIAQTPPPNSGGINSPTVSLLVADDPVAADTAAFVMPSITGLSLAQASLRLATAGLHITSTQALTPPPDATTLTMPTDGVAAPVYIPPPVVSVNATVSSQSPLPGHRVTQADTIRVTLSH